jgi:hypothetical protein
MQNWSVWKVAALMPLALAPPRDRGLKNRSEDGSPKQREESRAGKIVLEVDAVCWVRDN